MKLSQIKVLLPTLDKIQFKLENGTFVPEHFHVTEIGMVNKKFIDCGGSIRNENAVNFQLWNAQDIEHRLKPSKLLKIIALAENQLNIKDAEIEVEFQSETIGKYNLAFDGNHFILQNKQTACLAIDKCGIPQEKQKVNLSELSSKKKETTCHPGSTCC